MKRGIIAIALLAAMLAPAYAQRLDVKAIQGEIAVVVERSNGTERKIKVGDALAEGWKVIEIKENQVTIEKEINEFRLLREVVTIHREEITK